MKDDRLRKTVLFGQLPSAKQKEGGSRTDLDEVFRKNLIEIGTSWEGVKRESLNRLVWSSCALICAVLRQLGPAISCCSSRFILLY